MNDTLSSNDAMPMFYVGESDYYFTVPKSHPDIMAELDAAMTQILTSNPRYPDADIVMCDNTTACFDALSSGRAQAAIIPVTALDVVRSQNDLSTYKTAELPGTVRLTAWMRQDAPTLLAIANSQDNITAGTYTAQSYDETETTLVRFVRLYQGVFVAGVAVAFLGIMAILVWSLLRARKAQQEAQAASSAKTAFLSRMSHDIRTPLNGIIGILSVNEAHAEDAEYVSQNRKKARVAADHLLSLINDVLDMSKIEDSKVVLEHKPFNVIDVIDEVLVVGRLRAPEFGVTIESIGVKDLVNTDVIGSPDHVRRVLLNLVDNAVKYNRLGGTVRCAVDELGVKGNIVTYRFVVSDTGVGMSEEFLKRIFEPFTQAGSDARSNYQGTGMGMPIVKGFVEKMDDSIDVTSIQGEGSSFCVVLSFEIDRAPERHAGSADAEGECDVSGMRVLLAEDNDLNLEIATTLLADEGVAVTCAANGREAFDTFVDRPAGSFDAILMDIMMPVMDGYEAARAIRRSVKADVGSVPIFAMTANAFAEDAQRAHNAGMNGHLTKPIDMEKVKQALATARR